MGNNILANLTENQRLAAAHIEGPMLVLAGPGSGKTRVITHRIAYLISQGIKPWNILAITFTNKAAQEMRNRLAAMRVPNGTTMCTFHSLCARLLREFHEEVGLDKNFTIYDTADQKTAMKQALSNLELDPTNFQPGAMLNRISNYKNDLKTPDMIQAKHEFDFMAKKVASIYAAYQKVLEENQAVDFDDLLMKFAYLLRDDQSFRDKLNERYQYLLVDEYQDTNHCQYQIARGMSLNHHNLFVTGDPDQSIYGWRGADIGNILAFEEDYPNAKTVTLAENFRSTPEILNLADTLIQNNKERKHKDLIAFKGSGKDAVIYEYYNEYEEAKGLGKYLADLHKEHGYEYRQMAVFYRTNSMSRVLEEALRREHVPYQIVKGLEFFQRKEIKDMLAYLKLMVNPADQISLQRVINRPTRGIGNTTIARVIEHGETRGIDMWSVLKNIDDLTTINSGAKNKIKGFVELIENMRKGLNEPVGQLMDKVYIATGMKDTLACEKNEEAPDNVMELINSAIQYDSESEEPNLAEYLQQIALASDSDAYDKEAGAVSLMTLHAAKGLEFPVVVIVGCEEGMIPHGRSADNEKEMEEERRLLFVGITRAEENLAMSYAHNRTIHGMTNATIKSRFFGELPELEVISSQTGDEFNDNVGFVSGDSYQGDMKYKSITKKKPAASSKVPNIGFTVGQIVMHPSLGRGKITKIMPRGSQPKVEVQFSSGSRKTLVLQYARLEAM
ncbi:MAG: UvrD-helicase domain-containing protein [Phycisphaerae bacterium]|nr:UvrD-helicase domain-containing protein [Phycisphaerae bacterium]